jgi:hypothetical protein
MVQRATCGFVSDERRRAWGNAIPPKLMLRKVEVCPALVP